MRNDFQTGKEHYIAQMKWKAVNRWLYFSGPHKELKDAIERANKNDFAVHMRILDERGTIIWEDGQMVSQ